MKTTGMQTFKTAKTPDGMIKKFGNKGNTKETTLPRGGCPADRKGKAKGKY